VVVEGVGEQEKVASMSRVRRVSLENEVEAHRGCNDTLHSIRSSRSKNVNYCDVPDSEIDNLVDSDDGNRLIQLFMNGFLAYKCFFSIS